MNKCVIMKSPFQIPCESFCGGTVEYVIMRPDAPPQTGYHICKECLKGIVATIPEEFMPKPEKAAKK